MKIDRLISDIENLSLDDFFEKQKIAQLTSYFERPGSMKMTATEMVRLLSALIEKMPQGDGFKQESLAEFFKRFLDLAAAQSSITTSLTPKKILPLLEKLSEKAPSLLPKFIICVGKNKISQSLSSSLSNKYKTAEPLDIELVKAIANVGMVEPDFAEFYFLLSDVALINPRAVDNLNWVMRVVINDVFKGNIEEADGLRIKTFIGELKKRVGIEDLKKLPTMDLLRQAFEDDKKGIVAVDLFEALKDTIGAEIDLKFAVKISLISFSQVRGRVLNAANRKILSTVGLFKNLKFSGVFEEGDAENLKNILGYLPSNDDQAPWLKRDIDDFTLKLLLATKGTPFATDIIRDECLKVLKRNSVVGVGFLQAVSVINEETKKAVSDAAGNYLKDSLNKGLPEAQKKFGEFSRFINDRKSFFESLDAHSLFSLFGSIDEGSREFARVKIKEYCDKFGAGVLLFNAISRDGGYESMISNLDLLKDVLTIDYNDPYLEEIASNEAITSDPLNLRKFISALLTINSDNGDTAKVSLRPEIKINLLESGQGLVLKEVKDVVFLLQIFPELISDEVVNQLARDANVIAVINKTMDLYSAKYVNLQSHNLFTEINKKVPAGAEKIAVEKLHSFEALTWLKNQFPKIKKEAESEVKESQIFKLISDSNLTFDKFYQELSPQERNSLGLFILDEDEFKKINEWVAGQLQTLQNDLEKIPKLDRKDALKWTPTQRGQASKRQQLTSLVEEIKGLQIMKGDGKKAAVISCFKSLIESKSAVEKDALEENIKLAANSIDCAESTQAVGDPSNWIKFSKNLEQFRELATFCKNEEELRNVVSSTFALITQPNCPANLAILLQRQLESKRYEDPNQAAFAMALFQAAMPFLNSAQEVIVNNSRYEDVIKGRKNIFLPSNYFYHLIGKEIESVNAKERGESPIAAEELRAESSTEDEFGFGDDYTQSDNSEMLIKNGEAAFKVVKGSYVEYSPPSSTDDQRDMALEIASITGGLPSTVVLQNAFARMFAGATPSPSIVRPALVTSPSQSVPRELGSH